MEDWKACQRDIYRKLESIDNKIDDLVERDAKRRISIAKLEVKSGIWGVIGGALAGALHVIMGSK